MRRTETLEITDRGNLLHFKITEMSATQLESWIYRASLLLAGSGIETPDGSDISEAAKFIKYKGLKALGSLEYEKVKPLLDELLQCCERILPNNTTTAVFPETIDGYIEDVWTFFTLRWETAKFNLRFFNDGVLFQSPCSPIKMKKDASI